MHSLDGTVRKQKKEAQFPYNWAVMRIAQAMLVTDAAVLVVYGALSLLFVPGSANEPYWSSGRLLYGVLPAGLGLASAVTAIWLNSQKR